ncbi:MAG: phosphotransferase [Ktedonobacteraceae bacterium]|nr:phosphotransferase [Ktedonobacteraceae bacterium]
MNETDFFIDLLHAHYDVNTVILEQLPESSFVEGYLMYRIQQPEGVFGIARVYRRARPIPDWFRYFYPWSTADMSDWLETRAATLLNLERQDYLAPRVIRTRMGHLMVMTDEWCILVTAFIEGTVLQPTLEQLRLLGAAMGRLHTLKPDRVAPAHPPIGKSSWYTQYAISTGLACLSSIKPLLPKEWVQIHADFRQTFQKIAACSDLPMAIIHADGWAANAVQTDTSQVVLIDWDTSGLGLAVLDLGRLLLECHLDSNLPPDVPLAWHIQPDERRIAAVVDGYAQKRLPTSIELEVLLDAIRFGVAFIGTLHLSQVLQEPSLDQTWIRSMHRRWARLENRWAVSSEIASLARKHFEQSTN